MARRRQRIVRIALILLVILLAAGAAQAPAETARVYYPVVQHYTAAETRDQNLERLLQSSMTVSLRRFGGLEAVDFRDIPAPSSRDQAEEAAESHRTQLVLSGEYTIEEPRVSVRFELFDLSLGERIAETTVERGLDLRFTRLTDEAAQQLYEQAGTRIAELRRAYEREIADIADDEEAAPDPRPEPGRPAVGAPRSPVETSASLAAALPVLRYAEYFGLGFASEVALHYRFARLGLGLAIGAQRFTPRTEQIGEYVRTFVPVFLDGWLPLGGGDTLQWFARASCGAALRLHDGSPVSDSLAPALPAWRAGGGVRLALTERLTLAPELRATGMLHLYRDPQDESLEYEHIIAIMSSLSVIWNM